MACSIIYCFCQFLDISKKKKKKKDANNDNVSAWKSKRLSDEILIINIIAPSLNYIYTKNTSKICWKVFKTRKSHIYS